jgi:membrane fusion protein (multidrug efflux system)
MNSKRRIHLLTTAAVIVIAAIFLTSVGRERSTTAASPPSLPEAQVAVVEQRDLLVRHEWIGTLNGLVNAAINAEVTGYLLRQDYAEGSFVHKGQLLFEIDPRPLQSAVDQAAGQLAQSKAQLTQAEAVLVQARAQLLSAEANQRKSQRDEEKYKPLFEDKAVTRQDLDNAVETNQSNVAQVAAAKAQVETAKAQIEAAGAAVKAAEATLETAKVNLGFTSLTSLIDGIAGAATVQVGNLVTPSSPAVTTVSTLDPVKAVFTVSEQEYLSLARADALHHLQLKLILADGSTHPKDGRFSFADRQVDPSTGAIQMTALFPNPGNILRPGQYAMVRAVTGEDKGALLVPQPAVSELQGGYEVLMVGVDNRVATRQVRVGDRIGTMWVITSGLKPGDCVVVEGQQKLRPGMQVQPKPFRAS